MKASVGIIIIDVPVDLGLVGRGKVKEAVIKVEHPVEHPSPEEEERMQIKDG